MIDQVQDDTRVMSLLKLALALPAVERASYLKSACSGNADLFGQVWNYVQAEERMKGFLLEPLCSATSSSEYHFRPGDFLDARFRIVREVAQGGMGVVYEAVDEKLQRRIALKCAKAGFRKRLPPEVRNASGIGHPNVCKIFEIHSANTPTGETDFITMEFLDGETLARRLRRGALPEAEARAIAFQLCAGLAEAHRNGVVHGDLKAANVILTKDAGGESRAVITDFGMAHCSEASLQAARLGAKGGTPGYMAPELWRGEEASATSDIYALGVILYEMISGHKPHDAPAAFTRSKATESMAHEPNPVVFWEERLTSKPPPVHSKWDSVLARCLDPDPVRRFKDADEVIQALGPSRTRRWFLAAAAAVVLAVASGVITYQGATAPKETVRLAVLPFVADQGAASIAENLLRDAAGQIARLKSNSHTNLTFVSLANTLRRTVMTTDQARSVLGATHSLHGTLQSDKKRVILHAFLTDTRSGVNAKEWKAEYAPGEIRYAPVALAGLVTGTLHLPPLVSKAELNAAAQLDYQQGLSFVRDDREIDAALASFQRAVAADPDSPLAYAGLAEAQWFKYNATSDRRWLTLSEDSARQAERRNPDLAPVLRIAGLILQAGGWYEQAAATYGRAIELEPLNGAGHRRLGQAYELSSRLDQALAAYRKAIEVEPGYYRNYQSLGSFYYKRADYSDAITNFSKAVELAPDESAAHFALGTAYSNTGQHHKAENEFRTAIRLGETPSTWLNLAITLMYQARDEEAIGCFSQALSHWPETYLGWMNLATAYRRTNLLAQAERANRRALALAEKELTQDPRDGKLRSHLAYVCARLGDQNRAESEVAQALQMSPYDADVLWMAAWTYEALHQRDRTLAVLSASPVGVLADVNRWPDLADLHKDTRFLQLLTSHEIK